MQHKSVGIKGMFLALFNDNWFIEISPEMIDLFQGDESWNCHCFVRDLSYLF